MVVRCDENPVEINRQLLDHGIVGGLPLGRYFPDRADQMLVCVTEQNRPEKIQRLAKILTGVEVTP